MSGWDTSWEGDGSPAGAITNTTPRKGTIVNKMRNMFILLGSLRPKHRMDLGSRAVVYDPSVADTYDDHPEYLDFSIDWDKLIGGTAWNVVATIELRCVNVSTTARGRIVLAGTTTLVGSETTLHASTGWTPYPITITPSTGVKTYRVQIKRTNTDFGIGAISYMQVYAPEPTP